LLSGPTVALVSAASGAWSPAAPRTMTALPWQLPREGPVSASGQLAEGLRALKLSLSEQQAGDCLERELRRKAEALAGQYQSEVAKLQEENEILKAQLELRLLARSDSRMSSRGPAVGEDAVEAEGDVAEEAIERHVTSKKQTGFLSEDNSELSPNGKLVRRKTMDRALVKMMSQNLITWDGRPFESLIFEGGGTKGMVYAGAIQRLEEAGLLSGVRYFAGTSAGAQTAALVAVGYTGSEMLEVMKTTPWDKLMDKSSIMGCFGCFPNIHRLMSQHGWCKGEVLQNHLEELITRKMGPKCTLQQLYEKRGVVLRVGACNVATRKFELLDHETHPNMPVSVAARASSNIPLVFVPVEYISVRGGKRNLYVDGGLEGNIPMKAFPGMHGLAFDLMNTNDWSTSGHQHIVPESIWHFGQTILEMVMSSAQSSAGLSEDGSRKIKDIQICKIHTGDHGMLETNLTEKQVLAMVASGWDAVDNFLTRQSAAGVDAFTGQLP